MKNQSGGLSDSRIQVVAFDLNETLVRWREAFDESFKETLQEWVGRWSEEEEEDIIGRVLQRYYSRASQWQKHAEGRNGGARSGSGKSLRQRRLDCIEFALRGLPLPSREARASAILQQIRELQPKRAKLADGAKEALGQLSGKYRLAIISDTGREAALEVWERSGLKEFVTESHLFTPPAGKRKPDLARFKAVTNSLRAAPPSCVMVGDSWKRDIEGAVNAGWNAIWLERQPQASRRKKASRRMSGGTLVYCVGSLRAVPRLLI